MTVNILGTDYDIIYTTFSDEARLAGADGYCDSTTHEILIERNLFGSGGNTEVHSDTVLRHEIVHAYLFESGLAGSSGATHSWAMNEAMVDWIARMGPKLYKTWEEAGALN